MCHLWLLILLTPRIHLSTCLRGRAVSQENSAFFTTFPHFHLLGLTSVYQIDAEGNKCGTGNQTETEFVS